MELFAKLGDFFDHLALLVDLDRVDSAIRTLVFGIFNGLVEGMIQLSDARV